MCNQLLSAQLALIDRLLARALVAAFLGMAFDETIADARSLAHSVEGRAV